MVRFPSRIGALDRKLLRDLWQMKGQSAAIASVIAAGVAMFVMYLSNFESLQRTRATYYQTARFADVFASLKRAPASVEARIAALPGVEAVSTRVVADVTLDVPEMVEPATGRLVSIPERSRPVLNDIHLRRGRWIDPARPDEVLVSEMFARAHGFEVGDRVAALINGRKRSLTIVGIALSPEYVYAIRPGEMIPDTAVRRLLDGRTRARLCIRHGRRIQRRGPRSGRWRIADRSDRRSRPAHRAIRRPRRYSAITAGV
jgi:putative ABC transport system permease protein